MFWARNLSTRGYTMCSFDTGFLLRMLVITRFGLGRNMDYSLFLPFPFPLSPALGL